MASCTHLSDAKNGVIDASDCVNGTLMPRRLLPVNANHTVIHGVFEREGLKYPLASKGDVSRIPFDSDIIIYNRTKVNTMLHKVM